MKRLLTLIVYLTISYSYCQNSISLERYLVHLDSTTEKRFIYQKKSIDTLQVDEKDDADYLNVIRSSIANSGLRLLIHKNKYVFIYPNRLELEKQAILINNPKAFSIADAIRIGSPDNSNNSEDYVLQGLLTDESNNSLAGVNIIVDEKLVTKTDDDGGYSLDLKPGNYELKYSYVGLEAEERLITFYSSGNLDISLFPDSKLLDEVVVEANSFEQSVEKAQVGVQKISLEKLEKLPSFLGNVDVIKSATALPGVTVSGESSSYLNVRGGTNDQTLVLMNNTTIYNPGHLLGFFSVFNGDFISDMTIYKGNIPAKYGMRSSSVLDVKMNKWASKKLNVNGGIGLIDSNLGIKSKFLDDKLDIHVGGRISYVNWILKLIPDADVIRSSAKFGDANFSSRYLLDSKNSLFLTSYYGQDYFKYADRVIYQWQTFNSGLKWSRLLNEEWVLESELLVSSLANSSEGLELNDEFKFENGISELAFKSIVSGDKVEAGIDIANYTINTGEIEPTQANSLVQSKSIDKEELLNIAAHGSYLFTLLNDKLEVNPGVRLNYFMNYGPSEINIYQPNSPYTQNNVIERKVFDSKEATFSKFALEPRLGINYRFKNQILRASYSRINQFLHLISNTALVNPATVWKGSDRYIPPTVIDQYSLGYQYDFKKRDISISIDGFYKDMEDLVDYREGAVLLLNENLEQDVLRGQGKSYGLEFLVSKNKGILSGLVSYTYSRTLATVIDEFQGVEINSGDSYPYYTDRPHSIKASVDYKATKKWTISSNFTFITGAPISAPIAVYETGGIEIPYFSNRNSERIPDYHRFDLVVTLKSRIRKTKKNNDRWVLTLYNLYGRDNVANIYFSGENDVPAQPFQLVNVGRIVPTLTYKFEF
ncbi:TonB-dependent receptor [Ekhidna sp.]